MLASASVGRATFSGAAVVADRGSSARKPAAAIGSAPIFIEMIYRVCGIVSRVEESGSS
ncbi:MAG: hypothetical protein QOH26_1966 [Actinomycetota bacterium]|nr:hypothetical protein [Actinomycetota bacterium]